MPIMDTIQKHNSLHFESDPEILESLLFRVNDKQWLTCFFNNLQIVKNVLIVVDTHLLQDDFLLFLQIPKDILFIEADFFSS